MKRWCNPFPGIGIKKHVFMLFCRINARSMVSLKEHNQMTWHGILMTTLQQVNAMVALMRSSFGWYCSSWHLVSSFLQGGQLGQSKHLIPKSSFVVKWVGIEDFFICYTERGESVREMRRDVRRGESIKRGEKRCENGRIWQRLSHKTLEYSTNLHLMTGKRGFFWWFNKGIPALRNHIISTPIWEQEGNKHSF